MADGFDGLSEQLAQLNQQNLYRSRKQLSTPQGVEVVLDGKQLINFSSNDYLGLANHPEVVSSFRSAAESYGVGSGSAHLICGHTSSHHALEEELAYFTGRDRVLLFSTGYMANLGVLSALLGRTDQVLEDRLNHASLLDGGLLSGARFKRYQHNDLDDLQSKIKANIKRNLIVSDGVFSMDGDLALVPGLSALAKKNNAWLMVDDAHGFGVLGKTGAGLIEHYGLSQDDVPVLVGTLGKAFGTFGAFVAGSELLIETLIQRARSYIYTTAMPAAIAEATRCSLKILMADEWRREKLIKLHDRFRVGANQLAISVMQSSSAIQPILIGNSEKAVAISHDLQKQGFLLTAIRPPTVPVNQARLRITFTADHQDAHVDALLEALEACLKKNKNIGKENT